MATINIGKVRLSFEGNYDNTRAYVEHEAVFYGGETYACINDVLAGVLPNVPTYWVKIAAKGQDGIGSNITTGQGLQLSGDVLSLDTIYLDANYVHADGDTVVDGTIEATSFKGDLEGGVLFSAQAEESILEGQAVYVSGISGNKPAVRLADASDPAKMPAFGLALADSSSNISIVSFGTISNLDTSSFNNGDTLYVSTTPGVLTNVKPAGEANLVQNIGKVQRAHQSTGAIKVGGAGRVAETPNLDEGNIFIGNSSNQSSTISLATAISNAGVSTNDGGYEFTGGFTDRVSGTAGASDLGNDVEYTQAMVDSNSWLRFGLDTTRQTANDTPYWGNSSDPLEAPHSGTTDYIGKGLFSGAYMPTGVTSLFSFSDNTSYNSASTSGTIYNAATGSYDMSQLDVGDFCQFRFDFNLTPQFANTTVEVGLIWATRDSSNNVTFTFALTGEPLFYGAGTTGRTFLNRPITTAYLASAEDVNARALPAIRSDQPVFIQPLTTLFVVGR
jgi:hypothetical protein